MLFGHPSSPPIGGGIGKHIGMGFALLPEYPQGRGVLAGKNGKVFLGQRKITELLERVFLH